MLFAVEGGGFFSSSASGYSKGLALLLLGQRNEEKPVRVSPWNQYHLVEQRVGAKHPDSRKKQASCGCTSFICFGCKSAGAEGFSNSKVGSIQKSETSLDSSDKDKVRNSDSADESDVKLFLKSSLKKSSSINCSIVVCSDERENSSGEVQSNVADTDRRKIHWTDAHGKELAEIREFEPSESISDFLKAPAQAPWETFDTYVSSSERGASDDEFEHEMARRCQCVIQ